MTADDVYGRGGGVQVKIKFEYFFLWILWGFFGDSLGENLIYEWQSAAADVFKKK